MLGDGPLLATEVMVVLDDDAERARAVARQHLSRYMVLPNYTNNFLRLGFDEDDLRDGGSDRLVDGLIPWGDLDTIAARIGEHHAAGADHVCIQVLQSDAAALPRRLAPPRRRPALTRGFSDSPRRGNGRGDARARATRVR